MEIILIQPRGFCAGVVRAIETVERALKIHGHVYVLHEIVHNRHVVENLKSRGAIFVESLEEVPAGTITIFSAHGVSTAVVEQARLRNLKVIDATCPLVTKVHRQAQKYSQEGFELIIIGHRGHPEVEGTKGCVGGEVHVVSNSKEAAELRVESDRVAYVTQTTLSLDDTGGIIQSLKGRFSDIEGPGLSDICYATQSRQNAVREIAKKIDVLLVMGARNSSNSNRLREVGEQSGLKAHLIEDADDLDLMLFSGNEKVGITAGTSAPEAMVQSVLERLRSCGVECIKEMEGGNEKIRFHLPESL